MMNRDNQPETKTTVNIKIENYYHYGEMVRTNEKSSGDTYNVSSTNQSGGVTAGKIDSNTTEHTGRDLPYSIKWLFGVIGTLASAIAVYAYFF